MILLILKSLQKIYFIIGNVREEFEKITNKIMLIFYEIFSNLKKTKHEHSLIVYLDNLGKSILNVANKLKIDNRNYKKFYEKQNY